MVGHNSAHREPCAAARAGLYVEAKGASEQRRPRHVRRGDNQKPLIDASKASEFVVARKKAWQHLRRNMPHLNNYFQLNSNYHLDTLFD